MNCFNSITKMVEREILAGGSNDGLFHRIYC